MKTRHSLFALTFALLLSGCATGGAVPVDPMVPPGGIHYPDNPNEPHLKNLRRLTNAGQNAEAYFSPDGQRLIFQATLPGIDECDQQFIMGLDGQNLRMVSTGDGRTTCGYFYDGGDRIVYSSTHEMAAACPAPPDFSMGYVWALYDYDIYTATDHGGDLQKIFGSDVYDAEATLSPDGQTIVFTSAQTGDLEIYTMDLDGSNVRQLTHELGYDGGPFFSPDGTKIVYRASHPEGAAAEDYQRLLAQGLIRPNALDIWVMDTDGSNKTRITNNGKANFAPFFHPSGEKIIFSSNMHDPMGRDFDLYMINTDGTGLERVTDYGEFDGFPMWSPADPSTFVFASNRGGNVEGETNVYLADWVDDPAPLTLAAPVFPTGEAMPAEARAAHAAAGVDVPEASTDTVACPAFDPDGFADLADFTGRYLADDALEGRQAGSAGAACAAEFIAFAFRRLGLAPGGDDGSYFQETSLASAVNPHAPGGTGRNVLGILPGTSRELADEYVVIGAHFDHLGMGGVNSLAEAPAIHNGADDNASGVAALMEVAERLSVGPRPERTVLFMAFTGEESGLLGSSWWTHHSTVPLEDVVAMLNMDMVGRLSENGLVVYGTGTADEWEGMVAPALEAAGITDVSYIPDGYGASDQTSFYMEDIPVLHMFTNTHSDYHRPSDDWDRIDVAGIRTIAGVVAELADDVGDRARMAVIAGVGAPEPGAADEAESRGYGAYLGTIPDFSPVEYGVLLGGVREGAPADLAGMQKGDILVKIGDHDVADLYAMTDALRAYKPGDTVMLEWIRDGERMSAQTTLAARN